MRPLLACIAFSAWSASALGAACPTMVPTGANLNVFIAYHNPSSTCSASPGSAACGVGETITFTASTFNGYDFSCAAHTFVWNFGDGSQSTGQSATHAYSAAGQYTSSCTISNNTQNVVLTQLVTIAGSVPPLPTPTPTGCGTMRANDNVFISYHDQSFTCTALSGNCPANSPIFFTASAFGDYNLGCGTHSFSWNFGDGQVGSNLLSPTHSFAQGTYTVTCTVSGPTGGANLSTVVHVGNGSNSPPTPTPTPTPVHCGPIAISPVALPATTVGATFNATFVPSGGASPYSIFITSGAIPPGLTFWVDNISGIPTTAGSFSFNVYVVDSRGCGSVIPYTILVTAPSSCPLMVAGGNVFFAFKGETTTCRDSSSATCNATEPIQFDASAVGYNFNCFPHAFTWNFGDGELAGGEHATHAYRQSGAYVVTLTIANAQQAIQLTKSIVVVANRHRAIRR